jgi:hypothetical protein
MILKWEQPIFDLHTRLEANPAGVSDAEARAAIDHIDGHLQTNCDSAAQYLFFAIAPVCRSKPHLAEELLVRAVRPLYYLGIDTGGDAAAWLQYYLAKEQAYVKISAAGRSWIESLLSDSSPLQAALSRVVAEGAAADRAT